MFEGINALLKTLDKFNAIDSQCQTLSDEMQALLPELTDNAMTVQFAKDAVVELNTKLGAMRKGLDTVIEKVSPVVEEPTSEFEEITPEDLAEKDPVTIEPDFELSPEEDAALAETEQAFSESIEEEEDDESGIFVERIDTEPTIEDSPTTYPLDRVEDWDELYQAKVQELLDSGLDKEARTLKAQCLEVRETMYSEIGDAISMPVADSGMSDGAKSVWNAAMKEVSRLQAKDHFDSMTEEQKDEIEEMLADTDISDAPAEEQSEVDALLEDLEVEEPTEPEPQDIDDELEDLLASIDE